jgi:hypothetical protein
MTETNSKGRAMRFNTKDSFNKWRMCRGLCTICGHPLDRFSNMKAFEDKKPVTEEQMEIEEPLEEETPVRQALFRYCMLGIMNQSHIIDKHTFLSVPMAETEFSKCQPFFKDPKMQHFVEQVRPSEFQEAYRRCTQYCLEHTTPACRECNLAMTKKRPQNLVAVRCCPHTSNTQWQDFERNATVLARMNQIALYFAYDGTKWVAKQPLQMLMDGYLWRCVVQLGLWCEKPSLFRHRAVAVLYLAYLVFNTAVAWQKQFEFLDWHIHVFRRFYMHKYKGNTFAGYTDVQLRAVFASPMTNPLNWCAFVQKVQADVEQALQEVPVPDHFIIQDFNAKLLDQVSDEQTLLKLLARTARDNTKAVEQYLHYLVYNVKGSHVRLLALATAVQPPLVKAISSRRLGLAAGHVLRRLT